MDVPIQLLATEEETNTVPTENSTPTKESPTAPETFKKNTRWTPEEAVDNLFSKLGTYKSNSRKFLLKFCIFNKNAYQKNEDAMSRFINS